MIKTSNFLKKWRFTGPTLSAIVTGLLYWLFTIVYLELLLSFCAFGGIDLRFGYALAFGGVFACALALALGFLPRKPQLVLTVILTAVLIIFYGSQLVYYKIFGTLYSASLVQQGGAALNSFWKETLVVMSKNIPWILALFVPAVAIPVLAKYVKSSFQPGSAPWRIVLAVLAVVLQLGASLCLRIGEKGFFSDYYFYYSDTTTTDQAADRFGLLTAFRLDLTGGSAMAPSGEDDDPYYTPDPPSTPAATIPGETLPEQDQLQLPSYNILPFDFEALNAQTDSKSIQALNDYFAKLSGTQTNEYTGMLADYNLIVLCAEAFSPGAIHPELTPTLYRLANEGFVFQNYYNTFPNNTTDGEYTLCMGLYPDGSRGKETSSFYASRNSYLPFCLGNIFQQQKGIQSYGYHNYTGDFYGRDESHPNMGYTMKFAEAGMEFTSAWPASDLEMMEQSVDDYLSADEQFHAYYMTFSGHLSYSPEYNAIARKNWDAVKDLPLGEAAKSYISCNIELDKALAYLLEKLEEAGVADKTAIVLAGDHFPYGLTDRSYSTLVDYKVDDFTRAKSTLIFWVGGMEEPVIVDEYCSNADILPTILNLWGMRYDSRMLAGTDVFSDGQHIAILNDMSFYTDKVWLNASSGEIRYLVDKDSLPEDYVDNMIRLVRSKFTLSKDILNTGYYSFLFDKGSVSLDWESWGSIPGNEEPDPTEGLSPLPTGPEASQPETTPPDVTGPDIFGPAVTEPNSSTPDATEPDTSQPPETLPPDTTPAPTEPEITEPETTQPETTEPEETQPQTPQPYDPT